MKNFITFLAITMAIIFLFTSCGSSLTVTKRHYNNGYHVSFNKAKHSDRSNSHASAKNQEAPTNRNTEISSSLSIDETTTPIAVSEDVLPMDQNSEEVTPVDTEIENSDERNFVKTGIGASEKVHQSISNIKKSFSDQKELKTPQAREEGLSLLWIVIVVLLILWALGLIGGWGGGLIHLLLVIALVLLILWLLGII